MRILLTGRNGQVGWELERVLPALGEVIATDRTQLNLEDPDGVRRVVREVKPAVIVNAAAYTAVDKAESERELARLVNAVSPGVLAEEAKRLNGLLVHFSTDYVFDGEKSSPYREEDATNPLNHYGRTKLEGEHAIASAGCRRLILRTSWVYGPRGRNFFLTIAGKALVAEALRVVDDQHGVPTESRFVAELAAALVARETEGTFHVVPHGATTWHGFATAIVRQLGSQSAVVAVSSREYPTVAPRPRYSVLAQVKLAECVGSLPHWHDLLERCVTTWKSSVPSRL